MSHPPQDITPVLVRWSEGDQEALTELAPLVYEALNQIARQYLNREHRAVTLETGVLVNEAYLKLVGQKRVAWRDRRHFYAVAAQAMRRILVDSARRRHAAKRGGPMPAITWKDDLPAASSSTVELLALNEALEELARVDPDKSRVVELRFFAGLTHRELAEVMDVSVATVERQWRIARAWLYRHMSLPAP